MKQEYKTKRDTNGNTYTLTIDHSARTYSTNRMAYRGMTVITRKQRWELIEDLKKSGYTCND